MRHSLQRTECLGQNAWETTSQASCKKTLLTEPGALAVLLLLLLTSSPSPGCNRHIANRSFNRDKLQTLALAQVVR
jgi:hypothetical protein